MLITPCPGIKDLFKINRTHLKGDRLTLIKPFYFLLFILVGMSSLAQTASFSTIPAAVNGVVTICEGESILFTNTSTGTNSNTNYNWNFQGGNPNSPNGIGPHEVTYNNDGNYTATLTIANNNSTSVTIEVISNTFNPVAPTLASPSTSTLGYSSSVFEGLTYFRYCGSLIPYSSASGIPFNFSLPTSPPGTSVNIDWGDGTPNSTINNGSTAVSHTYNGSIQNEYTLTITYSLPGGCVITRTYGIFLGLAPTIQLSGNGNSACIPNDYEFNLLTNNVPNTTYVVIFNDNSPADTLIAPFNSLVTHTFENSSCGTTSVISGQGGTTISYPNSFASSIIATNACGNTFSSIGPIYVSEAAEADITVTPGNTVCLNQTVTLSNTSNPGGNVGSSGCDTTNTFYWDILQNSGYNIISGSTGDGTSPFWPFWTSGSYDLNLQFTAPGAYDIELVVANGCGLDSITETINVIQFPIIPSDTLTICTGNTFNYSPINDPPNTIVPNGTTYNWTVTSNPNIIGESNGSGNSISGTLTNTTNSIQSVTYTVTPSVNGCDGPPFNVLVEVVPGPIIPNYTTNICNNGTFTVTPINTPPTIIIPGGTTFSWVPVDNPNVNGEASGTGTSISGTLSTNITSPGQSVLYNVTASSGSTCPSQTFQVTVFLNLINPPLIAQDQTVCSGGNPALLNTTTAATGTGTLSYQWMSSTNGTTWSTVNGAINANYDPPAGITASTYYQVIATSTLNGVACAAPSNDVLITVNTLNPGTIGGDQTLCAGEDPGILSTTTPANGAGNLSYQWQSSSTSSTSGFTDIPGATGTSFDPPAGVTTTTNYQLVVSSLLNGQTCTAFTNPVTVTVNNISPGVIAQDQTVCSGGNPANITFTTAPAGSGLSYQWQSSTSSPSTGFTDIPNAIASNYDPPTGITTSTYYQVVVTSNLNTTSCLGVSNSVLVSVNDVSASVISGNQTICTGGDPNAFTVTTAASGNGTINYQWQSSTTSPSSGFSNISGATSATYDPPSGITSTTYYQVIATSVLNGINCSAISNVLTVNVNTVSAGTIGTNQTVCSGGDPSAILNVIQPTGASGGTLSYQWQSSTTSTISGFSPISGATNASYDPPTGLIQTTYYQLVVTSNLNGVLCSATSNVVTVNVNTVNASVIGTDQTVCSGGDPTSFTIITAAAGSSTPTYVWQSSTTSPLSGFTSISGITSATYDPPSGLTNTTHYQVIATSTLNGVSCSATSNPLTVTVIPNPIANAGPDVTINCTNNNPGLPIGMGAIGGVSYTWSPTVGLSSSSVSNPVTSPLSTTTYTLSATDDVYGCVSTDQVIVNVNLSLPTVEAGNNFTITCLNNVGGSVIGMNSSNGVSYSWTPSSGLNSSSVSNPNANPNTTTTYTLTAVDNANGCSASDQITVTVNIIPPLANAGADFTKTCVQNPNGAAIGDVSEAGVSYSWSPSTGLSAANVSNPIANPNTTTTYTLTVTNIANGCTSTDQVTVTVDNSFPSVSAGNDQVVCDGSNVTLTASGADLYNWSGGITDGVSFTPLTTATYTVTGTDLLTGCVSTDQVVVTVNPIPTINSLSNQVLCNSTSTAAIAFSGSVTGTVYSWTNSTPSIGLASTGQGNIGSFIGTNTTNTAITSTIIVTPTYTNLGLTCIGSSQNMTITVNPTPQVNPINNQGICVGSNSSAVNFSSSFGVVPTIYNWTNTNSAIGIGVSGTGDIPSFIGTNNSAIAINGSFEVTPSYTNQNVTCQGTPQSFLITINPTPTVVDPSDVVVCNNENVSQIIFTGSNANASYSWTNNNTSINLPATGNNSISSFASTNLSNTPVTATITVTPSLTNAGITCTGLSETFTITVNPTPTVDPLTSQALCVGSNTATIAFSSTLNVTGTTYSWTNSNTAVGLGANGIGNISSFTTTNSGNTALTGTLTVTPSVTLNSVSCTGPAQSMNIVVNPIPNVTDPTDQVVCNGSLMQAVNFNGDVTGTIYNWTNSNPNINLPSSGSGSIPTFVATNTTNGPISSTITVTPSFTNAGITCSGTSQTFTITVNPTPTVDPIGNQALCVGTNTSAVNFASNLNVSGTIYNWTNTNTTIGLNGSGTGNIGSFTSLNTSNTPSTATISVTPSYLNQNVTCNGIPQSFTIVVNPIPTVVDPVDQLICNGAQTNPVTINGSVSGTVYNWTNSNTSINLSSTGVGNIPGFNAINSTNAVISGTISVTPSYANAGITCTGNPSDFNITVLPTPTVDAINNQVECVGGATDDIVFTSSFGVNNTIYNWTNTNSSIGLPSSGAGNIGSFTTTNTGNTMITGTISVTPTLTQSNVTCQGSVQNFSISVNPIPIVNDPLDQVVCNGSQTAAVNFSGSVNGATYTWTSSNTNIGIASGSTGNILPFTATNSTNAAIQSTISVTPIYQFGNTTCTGSSQSFTITVNPTPTVDPFSNQVLCAGATTNPIQFSSSFGVNGTVYNWTNSNSSIGLISNGNGNIGAFTTTNSSNSAISGNIEVTPYIDLNGLQCLGSTQNASITVNPIPILNDPLDQVLCDGSPSNSVNFSGTVPAATYTWTNNTTSVGLSAAGTGNIPSFNAQNSGNSPVTATVTITPSYSNATETCTGVPQTMTFTVNPTPSVIDPSDLISCNGGTVSSTVFQGTGTTYTWTNDLTSIGLIASGTGNINSFTASNVTSNPLIATVTVTPQYLNSGLNCSGQSESFLITVNPSPEVQFSIPNQTICSQSISNGLTITSPTANADITWSIPNPPTGINGLTATNGTTTVPPMTLTNNTSLPITIEIFASASTPGSLTCSGLGSLYTITVNPTPQLNDPVDQILCNGSPSTIVSFTGTGTSYSWTNSNTSIGLLAAGNGSIPSFNVQNTSSIVVSSTVTVTPFYLNNSVNCSGPSQTFTYTINPTPTVNSTGDLTICNGVASNAITFNGTGTSYNWNNNNVAIGLNANGINIIPSFQGTNNSNNSIDGTVEVTPIFENLGVSCPGPVDQFIITVNPSPIVDDPNDQVICNNAASIAVNFTGTGTSYVWTNSNTGIGLGGNGTGNIPSFNSINSGSTPISATITVTPEFTGTNLTCPGAPQTYTYTINPTPSVDNPLDQVVCNGQTTQIIVPTGTATSYSWTNNTPSIGLAATGSGTINPFVANNSGITPLIGTVTITPTYTGSALNCTGAPQDVQFIVNPSPTVVDPSDQVVCNGSSTTAVNFSGNGTSYTWTNSNTSIGLAANGTGNIGAFNAINTTTSPITATITVVPNFTGGTASCDGVNQTFTITVIPSPEVDDLNDQIVCNGASTAPMNFTGTGTSYSWTNSNPSIGLSGSGSGNISSFQTINTGNNPISGTVTVTAQYTNANLTCNGQQQTIAINVNPTPTVVIPQNLTICNGTSTTGIVLSGTGTSYNWTNSNPGIGLSANGTGNIPGFNAINNSNAPIVATITITPIYSFNGEICIGSDEQFSITVNPTPTVTAPVDQLVCNGNSTFPVNFIGTGTGYNWTNTLPSIGLNAFGSGDIALFTAVNTSSIAVQAEIEVTPIYDNAGLVCDGSPQIFQIEVNPTPIVNDPLDVAYCNNTSVNTINFTGNATNYSWTNTNTTTGLAANGIGDILAFTGINSTATPNTSTVTVTPFFTNSSLVCPGPTQSFTITINPSATVNDPLDQVVCNQLSTAAVNFTGSATSFAWTNTLTSIGLNSSGTGDILAFNALNNTSNSQIASVTVTPQFNGSGITCPGSPETFTITVNPSPNVLPISPIDICNNSNFTVNLSSTVPSNYVWSATPNNNVNGEVTTSQSSSIIDNTLSNTTSAVQTVNYVVTPTSAPQGCVGPNTIFTVTVVPDVILNNNVPIEICSGASVNAVLSANVPSTFSWFTTIDNPNVSGESITTNTGNIINDVLINNTSTNQLVIYSVTPTTIAGNCVGPSQTIAVTVRPPLALLNEDTLTICSGNAVNLNLVANANVTFTWQANQQYLNITGESITAVTSPTINDVLTNYSSVTQQVLYSVVGSSTFNGCSSPVFPILVNVLPTPSMNPVGDVTVCNGDLTPAILFTGSSTGVGYSWTNSNVNIGLVASGTGNISSFVANNSGFTLVNANISVTPTITSNNVTCSGPIENFVITLNPTPTVNSIANQTICNNTSTNLVTLSGAVSGTVYSWTNANTSIGLTNNGTGNIPSFIGQNSTFSPIQGTVNITPTFTNNGVTCLGLPVSTVFTINPSPDVNPISNQILCNNSNSSAVNFTGNVANTQFTWTNSNSSIGLATTGIGNIPVFNAQNNGNLPIIATIAVTPTIQNGTLTCTGNTSNFTIQVNPTPTVDPMLNMTFCNNSIGFIDFNSTFMNNDPAVIYTWQNSNTAVGIPNSGNGDINFSATNPGNTPISSQITVTPTYTNNGVSCSGLSSILTITVNPNPSMNAVPNAAVCANTVSNQITFTGSFPGTDYSWINSNPSIGLASAGTGSIPPFTATNTSGIVQIANIIVTPTYSLNNQQCSGTPQQFTISVNPAPALNPVNNVAFCSNTNTNPITFSSAVSGTVFNWVNTNSAIGLTNNGTGDIPSFFAVNSGTTPLTSTLIVTPSFTNNGLTCTGATQTFTITINPAPTFTVPTDKVICNGSIASPQILSSTVPNVTYSWANNNTSIGLGVSGNGNIPSFTATNTSSAPISGLITVTASYTNGGVTCTQSGTYTITVNPTPNVADPLDQVVCHGSLTNSIVFQGTVVGTVFNWSNDNTTIGLTNSGIGDINPFSGINTTLLPATGTITVTPSYTNQGTTCFGSPENFTITVNPIPTLTDPADQVLCNNNNTQAVNFVGSVPNTVYSWQNNNISIGLAPSGTGNIGSFTAINTTTIPSVGNVSVSPSYTNLGLTCTGITQDFNITVNPSSELTNQNLAICSNNALNINLNSTLPASYIWQANSNPNVSGETFTIQNSASINDVLINTTNNPQTVIYQVTTVTTANNCQSGPYQIVVAVNPLPDVQFTTLNNPNCNLQPVIFVNNTLGNNAYTWTFGDNTTSIDEDPTHVYQDYGAYNVTLEAIDVNTGCTNSVTNIVSVFESPEIGFELTSAIGCNFLNVIFTDTINAPNTSLFWDFGDGETSNQPVAIDHQYDNEGCYDVTLTVTNQAGCSVSLTQDDLVCVFTQPDAIFFANPDSALVSEPVIAFDNQSNNAYTYYWDFGDGSTSLSTNPIHEYDDIPESYVVTLYAYNEDGCYDSAFLTVTIYEEIVFYVPNTFTPNGDGSNDIFLPIITSGIDPKGYELLIFNRWGEEVFKSTNPSIGWDGFVPDIGTYYGQVGNKAQDGTYIWKITMNASQNQDVIVKTGHVNLLR